jgi:hypothetical protein
MAGQGTQRNQVTTFMRLAIAVALLLTLGVALSAARQLSKQWEVPPWPDVHEHGFVSEHVFGCITSAQLDRYHQLDRTRDNEVVSTFLLEQIMSGDCRTLLKATEVVVEQTTYKDSFCVRPLKETNCLWTNRRWIERERPTFSPDP